MRILMLFSAAFIAGASFTRLGLNVWIFLGIAVPALMAAFLSLQFEGLTRRRVMLLSLGLTVGILYGVMYNALIIEPAQTVCGSGLSVTGTALDYSEETAYGSSVSAEITVGGETRKAQVYLSTEETLNPGDAFTVTANVVPSDSSDSYYSYSEGIWLTAYGEDEPEIFHAEKIPTEFFLKYLAHRLSEALLAAMPEDVSGVSAALTLGNQDELEAVVSARMKQAGIYHMLALSGMHMAILAGFLCTVIRGRKRRAAICIPVCILFTLITGAGVSLVRACLMEIVLLMAPVFGRENDPPTSLSFAGLLMVLQNPWCIAGWGLQLSYLSVIGILLFSGKLTRGVEKRIQTKNRKVRSILRYIISSVSVSVSAAVTASPLLALYFGNVSLVSPITNLLTGGIVGWCFGGSLLTAILGLFLPGPAGILGWVTAWGFRYILLVAGLMARIPFGTLYLSGKLSWVMPAFLYAAAVAFLLFHGKRILIGSGTVALYILAAFAVMLQSTQLQITALDVGEGQCLILRSGNSVIMTDCGGSVSDAGASAAEYLCSRGVTKIDLLVLTHYDSDHVNGVDSLVQLMPVEKLLLPDTEGDNRDAVIASAEENDTEILFVEQDTDVTFGKSTMTVFAPVGTDGNNACLSILATDGSGGILITGDMDCDTEHLLLKRENIPDVNILVAGHHGSKYSTSEELLDTVTPERVIISVGENSYGHPSEETLERIKACGAEVYRTDELGTVILKEG